MLLLQRAVHRNGEPGPPGELAIPLGGPAASASDPIGRASSLSEEGARETD